MADCWLPDGAYGKQEVSIKQIADNLENKVNNLHHLTAELGKKFQVEAYEERDFSNPNKYQAQKVDPSLTNQALGNIHEKLGGKNFSESQPSTYSQKSFVKMLQERKSKETEIGKSENQK